ncbi:lysis system o-spanin lipoprotein Rz1 [Enterobacter sp.]|uniref:lysis system o-spanin lipoprotein Rz1 n=1 Tax=Enterobacter sp. TaxID=42895 RepID=UPI0039932470
MYISLICFMERVPAGLNCKSTQDVPRTDKPAPTAWTKLSTSDLQTPLKGIITTPEGGSKPPPSN